MFGLGWSEMMVVGIVALIVIGPKDLPGLFRTLGEFTGKARGMAREFQKAMNDAARDSGVNDMSATLKAAANPKKFGLGAIKDATASVTNSVTDVADEIKNPVRPGPATQALTEERTKKRDMILAATAKAAEERKAREAAAAAMPAPASTPKPTEPDA